ncbi:MAG: nucleotidyltransferase family protein [Candidatus Bathyarchaeia archaeon]
MVEKLIDSMSGVCAAVLCGGVGSRLRPLTYYFQKAMIPVGSKQKPLLEYIILLLRKNGVENVNLLCGYKYQQIVNYFGSGERFNVKINYIVDKKGFRGTGWAMVNAYEQGYFDGFGNILVYYGDILTNLNIRDLINYHENSNSTATVAVSRGYRLPVGVAYIEGARIVRFEEKPLINIPVCIGIMILRREAFKIMAEVSRKYINEEYDLMGHLIPELTNRGKLVYAYDTDASWYDVGSTEKYEKLDNSFADRLLEFLER